MSFVLFSVSCGSSGDGVVVMFLCLVFSLVRRAGCMQRFYSVCSLVRQISCWVWRWWSFFTVASCLFSKLFHLREIHHLKSDFGLCYALLKPLLWIKAELTIFRVLTQWIFLHPLSSKCSWK